jgi:YbgC/YbaW family acyl-CoA thioester hydrolase
MTTFQTTRLVEWGDCDAAGIVYYPNYYRWMDGTFHALTRSLGIDQRSLMEEYNLLGTPLIDTGCSFAAPATYGDELTITARIASLGASSLSLAYTFARAGAPMARGHEARVFVRALPGGGIEKAPMPEAIRERLEALAPTPA